MTKLLHASSGNMESVGLVYEDGTAGILPWQKVLAEKGILRGQVDLDSVKASPDGESVEFSMYEVGTDPATKRAHQPTQFQPTSVAAAPLHEAVAKREDGVLVFQVQGQYGMTTLAFVPLGRHPNAGSDITEERSKRLTLEEVQDWYTARGWPKAGFLVTHVRNQYCGQFQLL